MVNENSSGKIRPVCHNVAPDFSVMPQLITKATDGSSWAFDLEEVNTFGRHPDNTVVLHHESVSIHHAEIVLRDGVWVLRDLESTNGTKINGRRVNETELHNTDKISFGAVDFWFKNKDIQRPGAAEGVP